VLVNTLRFRIRLPTCTLTIQQHFQNLIYHPKNKRVVVLVNTLRMTRRDELMILNLIHIDLKSTSSAILIAMKVLWLWELRYLQVLRN
jgi:hypothetical protein